LRSDPALLDRVLQNLVSNAMKYTRRGGVLVGCRRRGAHIALQVWDTGPGIAAEHRDDIFEEFFQLDNPARDAGKGLGLGLAIVQRIARLLDHPVRLQSVPGRGSMFSVVVPRGDAAAARGEELVAPALEHRFPGLRVAVIDDEPSIRAGMSELLSRWGCIVTAAASGGELIERIGRGGTQVDVLICDYRLGSGATGLDAVAGVRRALGRDVPTLLVTGDTAADRLREVHDSGYLLLHKPVAPAKLRQSIYHLLTSSPEPPAA
jgi:CheY-like chemotaxis protein/anti-sigma regulatory factor (Ser/Thr protein kinase)